MHRFCVRGRRNPAPPRPKLGVWFSATGPDPMSTGCGELSLNAAHGTAMQKFRGRKARGSEVLSASPSRDGVVVTRPAKAISNFGDSEVRVQTPRAGGTGWRSKRPVSFFPRLRPAIRRYLLTTCRGEGDCCKRPCCLLMTLLSGEPAGDQGTRLGKPPRREIRKASGTFCALFLMPYVAGVGFFYLYFA